MIVDNRLHRIHHSIDPATLHRNFGVITPIGDTIFVTAYFPKPDEWPDTGVADHPEPMSFTDLLAQPIRRPIRLIEG